MSWIYVWIHVTPRQIHHLLSAFSAKGAKTDFSSVHRLAVEPELLPCFTFLVQPATEIFLNMLSNTHFVYQREDNKKRKRRKQERKKVASSRRLWFPAGHLYCFQPSPTAFNLDGIPSFENRALRRGVTRSATPSFARGCETRICNSINNLILNVTISRPMKTYSPGKTYFFYCYADYLLVLIFVPGLHVPPFPTRSVLHLHFSYSQKEYEGQWESLKHLVPPCFPTEKQRKQQF